MNHAEIKQRLSELDRRRQIAVAEHKKNLAIINDEIDFVRASCQHEWYTRSIMGRETVTECKHCGKEQ